MCSNIQVVVLFFFKLLLKYTLINTFKKYLPLPLTYIQKKLPTVAVKKSENADDSRLKQSNFKCTTVVLLLDYCEYQKLLVTEIISLQRIIYINIHTLHNQDQLV